MIRKKVAVLRIINLTLFCRLWLNTRFEYRSYKSSEVSKFLRKVVLIVRETPGIYVLSFALYFPLTSEIQFSLVVKRAMYILDGSPIDLVDQTPCNIRLRETRIRA